MLEKRLASCKENKVKVKVKVKKDGRSKISITAELVGLEVIQGHQRNKKGEVVKNWYEESWI